MTWKEWRDMEDCNSDCPYCQTGICDQRGMVCYGGEPIEPPCCSANFPDDKGIDEIVGELKRRLSRSEEQYDRRLAAKKAKAEQTKKAADTRRRMKMYCSNELARIKEIKRELVRIESLKSLAESYAFAVNTTNEMFRYEERVEPKPELQEAIMLLRTTLVKAEQQYKDKRKEFYEQRKIKEDA